VALAEILDRSRSWAVVQGHVLDVLRQLPDGSVHAVVTSPPYWGLRDYGLPPQVWGGDLDAAPCGGSPNPARHEWLDMGSFCLRCGAWRGSLGLEPTVDLYVEHMVEVFREVRRVLRKEGTLWLNLGDAYATGAGKVGEHPGGGERGERWKEMNPGLSGYRGSRPGSPRHSNRADTGDGVPSFQPNRMPQEGLKPKDLVGMPWRVAFALQADGWWLRSDIVWAKPNPMPESVRDRPTKAHEYLFLLAKSESYFFDQEAVREPAAYPNGPNAPDKIASPYGQGFTRRAQPRPSGWADSSEARSGLPAGRYGMPDGEVSRRDGTPDPHTGRNVRTVWTIPTAPFPEAHFATFPTALVEPCVKAGTSEKGCCPECGTPWRRRVERERVEYDGDWREEARRKDQPLEVVPHHLPGGHTGLKTGLRSVLSERWELGCPHGLEPTPCLVLDPFAGAGTAGMVTLRLGRRFLGVDLSEEYVEMARERILDDAPLFNAQP
jgi:DNA modification methylase